MGQTMQLTRGRRLALAVGLPFALASVGYAGLNCVALASQAKYHLGPTVLPEASAVTFSISSGDLTVGPSADHKAHLEGTVNYSLVSAHLSWRLAGGAVVVNGPECFWLGNCGADLQVAIPAREPLRAASGSGTLVVKDLHGRLHLSDGSGDITVSETSGPLVLSDGAGNIRGTGLASATLTASDGAGNVNLTFSQAPAQVRVNDSAGDITVVLPGNVAYRVIAQVSSGSKNVDVPTDPASNRIIDLSDGAGNISVVPAGH